MFSNDDIPGVYKFLERKFLSNYHCFEGYCRRVLFVTTGNILGALTLFLFLSQKKKHHQLGTVLCGRCQLLSQGAMIPAVSGNGGYGEGKGFVSSDELRAQLTHLRYEKALIVKLVQSLL